MKNVFVADGGPFVTQADKNRRGRFSRCRMRTSEFIADRAQEGESLMAGMDRRQALKVLASAPIAAAAITWTEADVRTAAYSACGREADGCAQPRRAYQPKFFTAHEWATVALLVDMIIPKDEKSGSATDAGVPEFMDFMMIDQPARQTAMRGGLAWLDRGVRSPARQEFRRPARTPTGARSSTTSPGRAGP